MNFVKTFYDLIRPLVVEDVDSNEDYVCGWCGRPVLRRLLYCSKECSDRADAQTNARAQGFERGCEAERARVISWLEDRSLRCCRQESIVIQEVAEGIRQQMHRMVRDED